MKVKSLVVCPSPFIYIGLSLIKDLQKIGITAAYGLLGFCFGPKTLKYLSPIV
jgi:hypothetical protein